MKAPGIDALINQFDSALRTLHGIGIANRASPVHSSAPDSELSDADRSLAGRLMRVNHCGEICAQALYQGQAITSDDERTRATMQAAALEETDHLLWCESRLEELGTHKSYLNPVFYSMSFIGGAISGLIGNRFNLGFVAATEEQVVAHLAAHLEKLPANDHRSRAILEQMKQDEDQHRTNALERGGMDFPSPVKSLMGVMSKVMTRSTYWI